MFLDNENTKTVCIKGWSGVEASSNILRAIRPVDASYLSWTWYITEFRLNRTQQKKLAE